jgi:hypothetical protein
LNSEREGSRARDADCFRNAIIRRYLHHDIIPEMRYALTVERVDGETPLTDAASLKHQVETRPTGHFDVVSMLIALIPTA